jgi:hypothetical protein
MPVGRLHSHGDKAVEMRAATAGRRMVGSAVQELPAAGGTGEGEAAAAGPRAEEAHVEAAAGVGADGRTGDGAEVSTNPEEEAEVSATQVGPVATAVTGATEEAADAGSFLSFFSVFFWDFSFFFKMAILFSLYIISRLSFSSM